MKLKITLYLTAFTHYIYSGYNKQALKYRMLEYKEYFY